ncbi:unnamed protein product [Effrenium voratum]|nr:unnamed protein product [Effrenium voratum]
MLQGCALKTLSQGQQVAKGGPGGLLEALGSRNGSLLTYVRPGSSQAGPGAAKEPKLQEVGGDGKGPDASRGYDVEEYAKIWHMLQEKTETWPCVQKFSIIGPAGDDFVAQVQEAVSSSLGADAEKAEFGFRFRGLYSSQAAVAVRAPGAPVLAGAFGVDRCWA